LAVILVELLIASPIAAEGGGYRSGFADWRAAQQAFVDWELNGARINGRGILELDRGTAQPARDPYPPGGFHGQDFYNGGDYLIGEALSPATPTEFAYSQAVVSWNADTPPGTWIEAQLRARLGERWTKWYSVGVWASDISTVQRHSLDAQRDADGAVDVDTLVLNGGEAEALQLKMRLFSAEGSEASPAVRNVFVAYSKPPPSNISATPGNPQRWGRVLAVGECSQMVYPDGGEVWCSPSSTSMVLAYWTRGRRSCEPRVRSAVAGVYDWLYDGHGNWPFNTAYAATQYWRTRTPGHGGRRGSRTPVRRVRGHQLEAYVARLTSLAQAEEWIAAGVPVVVSVAWNRQALTGAPFPASAGHLAVLAGFDAAGHPVVNDPGAPYDDVVQRTYLREEFERAWLGHTGGTVYLIHPPGWPVPDL
jgi:hypothetical protein